VPQSGQVAPGAVVDGDDVRVAVPDEEVDLPPEIAAPHSSQ
jgi:hypothetical protein